MDTPADRAAEVLADSISAGALDAFARHLGCRVRDIDPMLAASVQIETRRRVRRYLRAQPMGERSTPELSDEEYGARMPAPSGTWSKPPPRR